MWNTEMNNVVTQMIPLDTTLSDLLPEVILCCNTEGCIVYANTSAHQWSTEPLEGFPFLHLLHPGVVTKGELFFAEARQAPAHAPTPPWELALGTDATYTTADFRGYACNGHVVLIGQPSSQEVNEIQQEMIELTSELAEAQREQRRQNRSLQQLLEEQKQLLQTIQELTAPAVPIWDGALLLPLVGHISTKRAQRMTDDLLERVSTTGAQFVILDMTGMALIDTSIAEHIINMSQAIRLLGATPVLVGINPSIAETIVHLGIDLQGFIIQNDLQHAILYVLRRLRGRL